MRRALAARLGSRHQVDLLELMQGRSFDLPCTAPPRQATLASVSPNIPSGMTRHTTMPSSS